MKVQRTIRVDRPQHTVVAYLADFGNAVQWDPGTMSCMRTDQGPIVVGSTWRNVSDFNGRITELDYRLERLEPARLTFVGHNKQATATDDLRFSTDEATTTITYNAEITFNGLLRLAGPLLRRGFETLADEVETSLTTALETL
ncbi:SRPBCC family protein [Catenulispora sp. NF23]|uniref:SRPBCC family protein n=1 Tax=Catenulispora pinistramenti TaxID=2705254 RepID=A0ABS5KRM6_9ACTN|nr:SRPBCC family protein [Catenulispora pinistramenti]MBS2533557.1 SRPBCC family protein [Catenulispora pinistramenti]MBS2548691.1 SRPBCC family protein [Catenulispora pinistramenti]